MSAPAIDFDQLSSEDHLDLIERLWTSLTKRSEAVPLTEPQRRDLDARIDELEREGPDGLTWEDVLRVARGGA